MTLLGSDRALASPTYGVIREDRTASLPGVVPELYRILGIVKLTGFRRNKPPYRVFRRWFTTDILWLFQLVMR